MRQDGEPSVEEILESIKKVIARDNRERASEERRRRETRGVDAAVAQDSGQDEAEQEEIEVLELNEAAEVMESAETVSERLTTESAASSMRESLAALAMLAEPGAQPQIVRSGETSLEGLVREMLRPMLAKWLDDNLPGMVERLVKAEIARIAGKKG